MSVSRNEACPCGSGRKYKKCCLGAEPVTQVRARRRLWIALGVVAVLTIGATLIGGVSAGSVIGLVGIALVGAWILMHDESEGSGAQSGSIMGSGSAHSGTKRRQPRASEPPGSR
jgi:hypothetical protein